MKIAIFYFEKAPKLFLLKEAAMKVGLEPYLFHFEDIRAFVQNGCFDLRVGDVPLKEFSLVFCAWFLDQQKEVSLLAKFCVANNIPIFDSALKTRHTVSKMYDLVCFTSNGLPVPKTVFAQGADDEDFICGEFEFPIVAKEDRSKRGADVFLIKNRGQLREFLAGIKSFGHAEKHSFYCNAHTPAAPHSSLLAVSVPDTASSRVHAARSECAHFATKSCFSACPFAKNPAGKRYQFQQFITADFDVRIIVIGGKVIGAIERRSADPDEFRHNISLGGKAAQIPVTPGMEQLALKAAAVLNYEFAGVDLITDRFTGETYILEVNRSPGFEGFMKATDIDVSLELMKFFLRKCEI